MKAPHPIPEETARRQAIAADPRHSVWVSANAGSGKTHVLSRRVIRLLLRGTDPSKILCLTYTRAAAANMAKRVYEDLAGWTALDDASSPNRSQGSKAGAPDADKLRRARRLFAEALETPGGLKIQTIHAFCEAILHQFPLEANIAGHFEMLDQQMEQSLMAEARRAMITGAAVSDNPALAAAFANDPGAGRRDSGSTICWREIVGKRDELSAFHRPAAWWRRLPAAVPGIRLRRQARRPTRSPRRSGRCRDSTRLGSRSSPMRPERCGARTIVENILPQCDGGLRRARSAAPAGAARRWFPQG